MTDIKLFGCGRDPSVFVDEFLNPEKVTEVSQTLHPNANKKWTKAEDRFLLTLHSEGRTVKQISKKMGRSQTSIIMRLGKLGEQIVLKSRFAFDRITYEGFEPAEKNRYYVIRKARNDEANQTYLDILEEEVDGLYMQDILRGGIANDDPRIPRNIP